MSDAREPKGPGNGPESDGGPAAGLRPQRASQEATCSSQEPSADCDEAVGLYAYQDLILSGLHKLLAGLIGDGAKIVLIVDHGPSVEVVGDHDDPWSIFDALTCANDEESDLGPGSRNQLLN